MFLFMNVGEVKKSSLSQDILDSKVTAIEYVKDKVDASRLTKAKAYAKKHDPVYMVEDKYYLYAFRESDEKVKRIHLNHKMKLINWINEGKLEF